MAATAAALALGVEPAGIRRAAGRFEGLEHRVEFVAKLCGVSFYNDSKATNPHAALHAIRSFQEPLVAIMGGRNKGLDFTEVAGEICRRIRDGRMRGLVLVGESGPEIRESVELACRREANGHVLAANDMYDSVEKAFRLAGGEGTVLFTPGCASFDMFTDYKDRGRAFKHAVARFGESDDGGGRD
jgi:UDP-N-acetylmuramoylalanine--D-glutamate ligase